MSCCCCCSRAVKSGKRERERESVASRPIENKDRAGGRRCKSSRAPIAAERRTPCLLSWISAPRHCRRAASPGRRGCRVLRMLICMLPGGGKFRGCVDARFLWDWRWQGCFIDFGSRGQDGTYRRDLRLPSHSHSRPLPLGKIAGFSFSYLLCELNGSHDFSYHRSSCFASRVSCPVRWPYLYVFCMYYMRIHFP